MNENITNAVQAAVNSKPLDFADYVNSVMAEKLVDKITQVRGEVASTLFGPKTEVETEVNTEVDTEVNTEVDTEE